MTAEQLAAIRAAIEADRAAEAGMTVGEWAATGCTVISVIDGEGVRLVGSVRLPADAAGIARARNRWAAYIALAEAVVDTALAARIDAALDALIDAEQERVHEC